MSPVATLDQTSLRRALQRLLAVVAGPVNGVRHEAVWIRPRDGRVEFRVAGPTATAVATLTPESTTDDGEDALVPVRILARVAARLPAGPVDLEVDPAGLRLTSGRFTLDLEALDPSVHAEPMPALDRYATLRTNAARLAHGLDHTVQGLGGPILRRAQWAGVQFEHQGDRLRLLGVDEFSVAVADLTIDDTEAADGPPLVVALAELAQARAFLPRHGDLEIRLGDQQLDLVGDDFAFRVHTTPMPLPDCGPLMQPTTEAIAAVRRRDLADAVERVALLAPRFHPAVVAVTAADGVLALQVVDRLRGRAAAHCPARTGPGLVTVHLPLWSLLAMVRTARAEHLHLHHEPAGATLSVVSVGRTDIGFHLRTLAPGVIERLTPLERAGPRPAPTQPPDELTA